MLLLLLSVVLAAPSARGLPVRILSRSNVDLSIHKKWNMLLVSGTLRDDRGAPIAVSEVTLTIRGWGSRRAITDAGGEFRITVDGNDLDRLMAASAGPSRMVLAFAGDSTRGPANAMQIVDLSRETLQLQVALSPPRMLARKARASGGAFTVLAVLRHGTEPAAGLELQTTVDGQKAVVTTGADGRAVFRSFSAPGPGRHGVDVRYAGSDHYNAVSATRELVVMARTTLTAKRTDDGSTPLQIEVSGQLLRSGRPHSGPVSVLLDEAPCAHATSGSDGSFSVTVDLTDAATRTGPRTSRMRAVYTPTESWEIGSMSTAFEVPVPSPPRVPLALYFGPLLAVFGAIVLATLWRSGRIGRWLEELRMELRPAAQRVRAAPSSFIRFVASVWEFLKALLRPWRLGGWIASLRERFSTKQHTAGRRGPVVERRVRSRPGFSGGRTLVAGVCWDDHLDLPLPGAALVLRAPDGREVKAVEAGEDGRFSLGELPAGGFQLEVGGPGFVAERIPIRVPHRGHLSGCRIRLVPLRVHTLAAYQRLVNALQKEGDRITVGLQTPRQIEGMLVEGRYAADVPLDPAALAEVTRDFEALYFGGDRRVTPSRHERAVGAMAALGGEEAGSR